MHVDRFEIDRNSVPVHHYMDGQTVYYSMRPQCVFTCSFEDNDELNDFHQWINELNGGRFMGMNPASMTIQERVQMANDCRIESLKEKAAKAETLENEVVVLEGRVKELEEEIESMVKARQEGTIVSLEV